ncbi:MAG: hypothetical protein ABJR08_15225, partial [Roseobacter sp.]
MADTDHISDPADSGSRPTPLGVYDQPTPQGITSIEIVALAVSGLWLLVSAIIVFLAGDADGLRRLMTLVVVVMPVGMIWVVATTLRSSQIMQDETQRLHTAIDAMRHAYIAQNQSGAMGPEPASVARKLDEIAAAAR